MGGRVETCLRYGLVCRVCGYLDVRGVDAVAGGNRRTRAVLSRCRVDARLDSVAARALTGARRHANCVLRMVDSPVWSPSIDGMPEHARAELGSIGALMALPMGFWMAFRAWLCVEAVLEMPTEQAWPVSEIEFHREVNRTLLGVKHAVCDIMAVVVQKVVPLGQRMAFAAELSRQYGMLDGVDRVPEHVGRRIIEQVFNAHSRSIARYLPGSGLGRHDRRVRARRW